MRHLHAGRKLGVAPHHRRALMRSLTLALIERDSITTTRARAKELRWFADRIITLAKQNDLSGRRHMVKILGSTITNRPGENRVRNAMEKVYSTLVPRFDGRNGGYTQIFHLVKRRAGDNSEMCLMRYIPSPDEKKEKATQTKAKKEKKSEKKVEAADKDQKKAQKAAAPKEHAHKEPQDKEESKKKKAKKEDKE